jgi:Dolichyl-phosphate-mannose-protein mannosyltransferase
VTARQFGFALVVVVAAGLAVRVAFTVVVDPKVPAVGDASAYHLLADELAAGHGMVRPFDLSIGHRSVPTAEFPPLFPSLLAVVAVAGGKSVLAQRLAMTVVGAGTVALVGLLGRRVAGPGVGLLAAAGAAVHPMLFQSDATLMSETLDVFLVTLALVLAYRAVDRPTPARWAVLGLVLGAAALTRAEGLLLAVLLVVPLAGLTRRRWRGADLGDGSLATVGVQTAPAMLAGAALLAVAVALVPWTVRNVVTFHELLPTSHNYGTALAGANCDRTWFTSQRGLWLLSCVDAVTAGGPVTDEAATARRERAAGVRFARHHLGRAPAIAAVRLGRTWGVYDVRQQVYYETLEGRVLRWQRLGTHLDWVLYPLALAGLVVLARRREPAWPLASVVVAVSIAAVLTYGNQRFRAPAEPVLLVLAASPLVLCVESVGRRRVLRTERRGEAAGRAEG